MLSDTIDGELLDAAGPQCRIVADFAVGYNNFDFAAATARGVILTNTPGEFDDHDGHPHMGRVAADNPIKVLGGQQPDTCISPEVLERTRAGSRMDTARPERSARPPAARSGPPSVRDRPRRSPAPCGGP